MLARMASAQTVTTRYRGWRIESRPYSHRGRRSYEAGIYGSTGLADVAHGRDRLAALADAQSKIDAHLSGARPLHNLGLDPYAWSALKLAPTLTQAQREALREVAQAERVGRLGVRADWTSPRTRAALHAKGLIEPTVDGGRKLTPLGRKLADNEL
jgi:hypothetical protein